MKSTFEFFPWTEALGWTLLNSLWQGLLVLLLVIFILRMIPSKHSQARYVFACISMLFFVIASIGTFFFLFSRDGVSSSPLTITFANGTSQLISTTIDSLSIRSSWDTLVSFIQSNMNLILLGWVVGATFFSLRMMSSWWYVSRLQSGAEIITSEWNERLQSLAAQLTINKAIMLAQSWRIEVPLVLGFVKPIVLVPVGMFSGLTTEQIETIFIHELAHIKRHDYLVNLIQSIIETIFFFNPFVWIMSNIIRREREYCCDDAVVQTQHNALIYAKALTTLEDVRLTKSFLALSLAENKNQLLNRIKRLMEKSVKNYSGRDRLIPALLLVIGLLCASWLTIKSENSFTSSKDSFLQDTTKRKNRKSMESIQKAPTKPSDPTLPETEEPVTYTYSFKNPDGPPQVYEFKFRTKRDWEEFSKQFEEKFRDKFQDFYKGNSKDFQKLMDEMRENFKKDFDQSFVPRELEDLQWIAGDLEEIQAMVPAEVEMPIVDLKALEEINALAAVEADEWTNQLEELDVLNNVDMEEFAQQMQEHAIVLEEHGREMEGMQLELQEMEGRMKSFEREIKHELVKDGYLKEGDEIRSIDWDDNGSIQINGKKIKESDEKKYHSIHKKYFKDGSIRFVQ